MSHKYFLQLKFEKRLKICFVLFIFEVFNFQCLNGDKETDNSLKMLTLTCFIHSAENFNWPHKDQIRVLYIKILINETFISQIKGLIVKYLPEASRVSANLKTHK